MPGNARTDVPLIFTHYGANFYLPYTLYQAKKSNPQTRCILIGDDANKKIATQSKWEHVVMSDIVSKKCDHFNAKFRWIQGKKHNPIKGGKDWLRYVFERFFAIEEFIKTENLENYWHFDSDTMILKDLKRFEQRLREANIDCTTLCNDMCPSGFIKASFTESYTNSIISNFEDNDFLRLQQREFDKHTPENAFTEMRAFTIHRRNNKIRSMPLSSAFRDLNIWFDDCICQEDGFETTWGDKINREIKNLYWDKGKLWANQIKINKAFTFATVNCSWTSELVFQWIASYQEELPLKKKYIKDYLKFNKEEAILNILKKISNKVTTRIFKKIIN